ncbi:PAS domain S-box protein [Synoicihabitans lomoniglobus]|uniref:histidine kinase n=1 Tax=Synoicihabitans lomoniglobus TaxID=2909285 RepID=A0AAE9ZVZ9_9BACT|nr:PAS domain S-box protein [Opitutaceae bacterium LMO-M01]WED64109.1 PAS domain S-box protein [Opitutaceae bacterium LMO-M01]
MSLTPSQSESARLAALRRYEVLDSPAEEAFDDFASLACRLGDAPIALVSFVDAHRQWFKSRVGWDQAEWPRENTFCDHTIAARRFLMVPDTRLDPRFSDHPWATAQPAVRFYAGAPLVTAEGHAIGTICILDHQPRKPDAAVQDHLERLSRMVMRHLENRRATREARADENQAPEEGEIAEHNAARTTGAEDAERLQFFTNATREAVIMHDHGRILDVNPACIEMFGYTRAAMIGQPLAMLVAPESLAVVKQHALSETVANYEVRGIKQSGEIFEVEVSSGPIRFRGKTIRFGCVRDLTDRKQIEALGREAREKSLRFKSAVLELRDDADASERAVYALANRVVVDALQVDRASVWRFDASRQYLECEDECGPAGEKAGQRRTLSRRDFPLLFTAIVNEKVLTLAGRDSEELTRELRNFSESRARLMVPLRLGAALFGVLVFEMDAMEREWTGEEEDFGVAIAATILLALENAKRREAEEETRQLNRDLERLVAERTAALRESETHFRAVLDSAHDAIISANDQDVIISWNHGAEEMFGRSASDAIGQNLTLILAPRHRETKAIGVATDTSASANPTVELHGERADGSEFPIELSVATWTGPQGRYFTHIVRDITLRKKIESANLRKQRLENIGNLAGGISHDLNNALAPVLMGVNLLRRSAPPSEQVSTIIDAMESSARHGAAMIRQLLMFARGVAGERLPIAVPSMVDDLTKIVRSTFPRAIKVRATVEAELPPIVGDPTQLHQILLNLCVNARDAMADGGVLGLSARVVDISEPPENEEGIQPGKFVCLLVSDTGTGMPPEVVDRIFEPFFTTKDIDKGTGLGLSTVVGIVKSHEGFMRVTSTVGTGTTFEVYLPAGDIVEAQKQATAAPFSHDGRDRLILVVEDDPTQRMLTRVTLESQNYRVLTAMDGAEAMIVAGERGAELAAVITDVDMPEMNGLAFTRALKRMASDARVIVASGRLEEAEVKAFGELGVTELLHKPFKEPELLAALERLLA